MLQCCFGITFFGIFRYGIQKNGRYFGIRFRHRYFYTVKCLIFGIFQYSIPKKPWYFGIPFWHRYVETTLNETLINLVSENLIQHIYVV